jgi:crossover junction endodeoxyribonuclease RuvC
MKPTEVILAIDPGTLLMGFAVMAIRNGKPVLVTMDALKLSAHKDVYLRLQLIHNKVSELIMAHKANHFCY